MFVRVQVSKIQMRSCNDFAPNRHYLGRWWPVTNTCRQTSNISRTQSQNLDVSRLVLQLPLPKPLKPVENEDVGAAPTASEWSSMLLPKVCLILEVWPKGSLGLGELNIIHKRSNRWIRWSLETQFGRPALFSDDLITLENVAFENNLDILYYEGEIMLQTEFTTEWHNLHALTRMTIPTLRQIHPDHSDFMRAFLHVPEHTCHSSALRTAIGSHARLHSKLRPC